MRKSFWCSWIFRKFHRKTPVLASRFKRLCNFIKKRLQYKCFLMKFRKFLRTSFFYRTPPSTGCLWPCQISKMMRDIENLGIVRTVYSGIFKDDQQYLAISRSRHIQVLFRHIQPYLDIFRTLSNAWIYKSAIFRTFAF